MAGPGWYNVLKGGKEATNSFGQKLTYAGLVIVTDWFAAAKSFLEQSGPNNPQKKGTKRGKVLYFQPGYAYLLASDEVLTMFQEQTLLGVGKGSIVYRAQHSSKPLIAIKDTTRVTVRELVLDAGESNRSVSSCVQITGSSQGILVEDVCCLHAMAGIQLEGRRDIRILGCDISNCVNGIVVGAPPSMTTPSFVQDVLVSQCLLRGPSKNILTGESDESNGIVVLSKCRRLNIENNFIKEYPHNGLFFRASGSQMLISSNEIQANGKHGVFIQTDYHNFTQRMGWQAEGLVFIANRISENKGDGINIQEAQDGKDNPFSSFLSNEQAPYMSPGDFWRDELKPASRLKTHSFADGQGIPDNLIERDSVIGELKQPARYPFLRKKSVQRNLPFFGGVEHFSVEFGVELFPEGFAGVPWWFELPTGKASEKDETFFSSGGFGAPFNILVIGNQIAENQQCGVYNEASYTNLVSNLITDNATNTVVDFHGVCYVGPTGSEVDRTELSNGLITNNIIVNNGRDVLGNVNAGLFCENTKNLQVSSNIFNRDAKLDRSKPTQSYVIFLKNSEDVMISGNFFGEYLESEILQSRSSSYTLVNNIPLYNPTTSVGIRDRVALARFDEVELKNIAHSDSKAGELVYVEGLRHLAYYDDTRKEWVYLKAKTLQ